MVMGVILFEFVSTVILFIYFHKKKNARYVITSGHQTQGLFDNCCTVLTFL